MSAPTRRCPFTAVPAGASCPDRSCPADPQAPLPRRGGLRAAMLALRFVAAAAETGDGACFDAAFAEAEAAFGVRDGALVVARAAALLRAARRDGVDLALLPPACRALSRDETRILTLLRDRDGSIAAPVEPCRLIESPDVAAALADFAAVLDEADSAASDTPDWTRSELARSQFPLILS